MTQAVAAQAMHRSRALVAKASFSSPSASEPVANVSGPSAPIKKSVGAILPLFRIQKVA